MTPHGSTLGRLPCRNDFCLARAVTVKNSGRIFGKSQALDCWDELGYISQNDQYNMYVYIYMGMGQNLVPHIKIAGKWMFIPLKMVLIGIDPYPYNHI